MPPLGAMTSPPTTGRPRSPSSLRSPSQSQAPRSLDISPEASRRAASPAGRAVRIEEGQNMVRNVSAQGRQLPTRHLRPPQPPPASLGSASNAAAGDDTRAELLRTQAEIEELRALVGSAALAPGVAAT